MRRVILWSLALLLPGAPLFGRTHLPRPVAHDDSVDLSGAPLKVGGLVFALPPKWVSEPISGPTRAGQWRIPAVPAMGTETAELTVIFFGPNVGGSAKENIDAWTGTMLTSDGRPVTPAVRKHTVGSFAITEVTLLGTYSQFVPMPGLPPVSHPGYGLLGAVVENPQGNSYWCLTGPAPLVTSLAPLLTKVLDSVKPQDKTP